MISQTLELFTLPFEAVLDFVANNFQVAFLFVIAMSIVVSVKLFCR